MNLVRRFVVDKTPLTVLDLGSGTGRFSIPLADALHAHLVGVEPADEMRKIAMQSNRHLDIRYIKGSAEKIPLENSSCDIVWMSMVVHHISRLDRAVREIRRVLKPDGKVFIRNSFRNRLQSVCFYEFFPTALAIDNARLPSVEDVEAIFQEKGFQLEYLEAVEQVIDATFRDHVERIRKRGLSTFELISDEEFEVGLRRMEEAAQTENLSRPVTEKIDLMVFSRWDA
jgi:ubiquinone/menaquinone biosynthesis C-methylase UbiE